MTNAEPGIVLMTGTMEQDEAVQSLDELARRIEEEHEAAERAQFDSVRHAREAGELLIQVKALLTHGDFMSWVKEHCTFAHSTANLYMQIARKWVKLGNSQRIRKLSLVEARVLLSTGEYETALSELITLGIVRKQDLDGLSETQARVLVTEVQQMYHDFVEDPKRAKFAREWKTRKGQSFPSPLILDPTGLRTVAYATILRLRQSDLDPPGPNALRVDQIRRRLRGLHDAAVRRWRARMEKDPQSDNTRSSGGSGGRARMIYSPFDRFGQAAEYLIEMLPVVRERHEVRVLVNRITRAINEIERKEAEEAEERRKNSPHDWTDDEIEEFDADMAATHPERVDLTEATNPPTAANEPELVPTQ